MDSALDLDADGQAGFAIVWHDQLVACREDCDGRFGWFFCDLGPKLVGQGSIAIEQAMHRDLGGGKVIRCEEPIYGGANGALKIAHDMPATVAVRREFGELPPVLAYSAQLNQAFLSLVRHAIRDTAAGGAVTVRTEPLGERVRVVISDTGCGYQPDALLALFNPSFKADTSRMRMDWEMVTASRIVDRHQGVLTARSTPGEGTRYTIEIPVWAVPTDDAIGDPSGSPAAADAAEKNAAE